MRMVILTTATASQAASNTRLSARGNREPIGSFQETGKPPNGIYRVLEGVGDCGQIAGTCFIERSG